MVKHIEFNKIIVAVSVILAFALTVVCVILKFLLYDINDIIALASILWSEVSVVTGTYANKTKALNKIKMIGSLPKELRSQVDPNQILN